MANFVRQQSTFLALNFVRRSTYYGKEFDAFGFNFAFQVTCTALSINEMESLHENFKAARPH